MENEIETGGSAFPQGHQVGDLSALEGGMSLRDYYAAHAPITGVDANESLLKQENAARFANVGEDRIFPFPMIMKELVRLRWEYADAMLAAREGKA